MPKQAVRTLIQLRKSLDTIEADLAENRRQTDVASVTAVAQLGSTVGDERLVKFAGETWRVVHRIDGLHILPQVVDDDI